MRISTLQFFRQNLQTFNAAETRLLELQNRIATGVGVNQASDNPEAFITALKAQDVINEAEQYNRNITLTRARFSQQESSLGNANDILDAVRDLALQAGNGTANAFDRRILAQDMLSRRDELAQVLNSQDIDGLYIFGPGDQTQPPLSATGALPTGPAGRSIEVDISAGRRMSTGFNPQDVFRSPVSMRYFPDGSQAVSPYSGSVVDLVESLAAAVEAGDNAEIGRLTGGIESANENLLTARIVAGTRTRQLDDAENFNSEQILQASAVKEKSVGADLSETISQLTQTDAQLRALQVTYSQITKNSLFDLI